MQSIGSSNGSSRWRMMSILISMIIIASIFLVQTVSADAEPEIRSGSTLVYDRSGHIREFSIWITFPEPMDTSMAENGIEVRYTGDSWFLSDPDMPFEHNWSSDRCTIFISSGSKDLSSEKIYSIGVSISNPMRTADGGSISFNDRSSVELVFGDSNMIDLGFGFGEIFAMFVLPFVLLAMVVIATEIVLRAMYGSRRIAEKGSTVENLLKLIDRSERWMRRRYILASLFALLLISMYVLIALIAIMNLMFAMVATILLILFVLPWLLFLSLSVLYFLIRKEDLHWKRRLAAVRKSQMEFMRSLEKE